MSVSAGTRLRIAGLAAALLLAARVAAQAGPVNVSVSGIRNSDGVIRCGLFNSPVGFREPGKEMMEAVGQVSGGRAGCAFKSVAAGTYAVAVFHAERGERKMDIGPFGKPSRASAFPTTRQSPSDLRASAPRRSRSGTTRSTCRSA